MHHVQCSLYAFYAKKCTLGLNCFVRNRVSFFSCANLLSAFVMYVTRVFSFPIHMVFGDFTYINVAEIVFFPLALSILLFVALPLFICVYAIENSPLLQ